MKDQAAETLVGAVVLAIAAVFLVYSLSASGERGGGGYELKATFAAVDGLNVGADVRLSGVKVGTVSGIDLNPSTYQATVAFRIDDTIQVPADSSASLRSEGLLGGVYLAVEPGVEAEMLEAGEEIPFGQGAIDVLRLLSDFIAAAREE